MIKVRRFQGGFTLKLRVFNPPSAVLYVHVYKTSIVNLIDNFTNYPTTIIFGFHIVFIKSTLKEYHTLTSSKIPESVVITQFAPFRVRPGKIAKKRAFIGAE